MSRKLPVSESVFADLGMYLFAIGQQKLAVDDERTAKQPIVLSGLTKQTPDRQRAAS